MKQRVYKLSFKSLLLIPLIPLLIPLALVLLFVKKEQRMELLEQLNLPRLTSNNKKTMSNTIKLALTAAAAVIVLALGAWWMGGNAGATVQETCPSGSGWTKVEPLSGKTYTWTAPTGYNVIETCYKHSTYVHFNTITPAPSATVTADKHCTKWYWWGGCEKETQFDLSHASFKAQSIPPVDCVWTCSEFKACGTQLKSCEKTVVENSTGTCAPKPEVEFTNYDTCEPEVSCPTACGLAASLVPNGKGGEKSCEATPKCSTHRWCKSIGDGEYEAIAVDDDKDNPEGKPWVTGMDKYCKFPARGECTTSCGYEGGTVPNGEGGTLVCEPTNACSTQDPDPEPTDRPHRSGGGGSGCPSPEIIGWASTCWCASAGYGDARCASPTPTPVPTPTPTPTSVIGKASQVPTGVSTLWLAGLLALMPTMGYATYVLRKKD